MNSSAVTCCYWPPPPHAPGGKASPSPRLNNKSSTRIGRRYVSPSPSPTRVRTSDGGWSPPVCQSRDESRDLVLRSSELATLAAIFHFSGTKPSYLGVQKRPPSLALCPATNNCVSTSERISDSNHYAPPWNYNPKDGPRGKPISKDEAMKELIEVVTKTKPDNFSPRVVEKGDDYVRVEYESPIFGFVDDVEFWFPPGNKSIVQYRSASRSGFIDFNANKKRVKALRLALEKKGWASESTF
ncbi:hypothetical protein CFC21_075228 [Triticum aestivum]|uniref:DUF1499 domain-containing protein n=2 Tax=Triticum aestivum TaxID=4565 RepID=A0A3B6LYV1_WHEAT|nr:hypothetical protein CFC21_075228 [Triticum aestivum]